MDEYELQRIETDKNILSENGLNTSFIADAPQAVREKCDFYHPHYGCLIRLKCSMIDDRCDYFERVILPQLTEKKANKIKKQKGIKRSKKRVRYCKCGNVLQPRKQLCPRCKAKRDKQSQQRAYRKRKEKEQHE